MPKNHTPIDPDTLRLQLSRASLLIGQIQSISLNMNDQDPEPDFAAIEAIADAAADKLERLQDEVDGASLVPEVAS